MKSNWDFLVFGDAHVEPGQSLERFDWIGELIVEEQPEWIVQLGDFVSMLSLSHWDQNKRLLMEGRRFNEDIGVGLEAIQRLIKPLLDLQATQRASKKKVYRPNIVWCDGNHEEWTDRYIEQHPEVEGYIKPFFSYAKEHLSGLGDILIDVPYKDYVILNDVAFCHSPIMGNAKPIGGKYVNEKALDLFHTHVVFGHTHRFLHSHRYLHGLGIKQSVNAGCFFDETPTYAKGAANEHFRTVVGLSKRPDDLWSVETRRW